MGSKCRANQKAVSDCEHGLSRGRFIETVKQMVGHKLPSALENNLQRLVYFKVSVTSYWSHYGRKWYLIFKRYKPYQIHSFSRFLPTVSRDYSAFLR